MTYNYLNTEDTKRISLEFETKFAKKKILFLQMWRNFQFFGLTCRVHF